MINVDAILVSLATNNTGGAIMIVARKQLNKEPDIINAIEGPEARDIYEKLIGKKEAE